MIAYAHFNHGFPISNLTYSENECVSPFCTAKSINDGESYECSKSLFHGSFQCKESRCNETKLHKARDFISFFFVFLGQKLTNKRSERVDVLTECCSRNFSTPVYVKRNNKGTKLQFSGFINCD